MLKAIDEYLIKKGVDEKESPQPIDAYREMMRKYVMVHNDKLMKEKELD